MNPTLTRSAGLAAPRADRAAAADIEAATDCLRNDLRVVMPMPPSICD